MTTVLEVNGVRGGTVKHSNINVAGIVYGGMSNKNNYQGSRAVDVNGDVGIISNGDNNSGKMTTVYGSQNTYTPYTDPRTLTSVEMVEHLQKSECSEDTMQIFSENKVTGILFMDHFDDELLNDLNITDNIEKRKLRSLHKYLGQKR